MERRYVTVLHHHCCFSWGLGDQLFLGGACYLRDCSNFIIEEARSLVAWGRTIIIGRESGHGGYTIVTVGDVMSGVILY